ncbi:RBBP9/YdeN family alpha/beta hydrolase [Marinomonas sp. RS-M-Aa-14]|uniref:RBBP9/YdeN family alpha/beta hydrolase n=1 Tax=Marinomonas sp. RS-M-Aa-14 TaxID=3241169 RepID=UPI00390C5430
MKVLILPGIGNSDVDHWQSHWEKLNKNYTRVNQLNWDHPDCSEWCASLEESVRSSGPDTILVAHSLGGLLVAHWAAKTHLRINAAMLVAVPDPNAPIFPSQAIGFKEPPMKPLPFKSIVVASINDPYSNIKYSEECASIWGSDIVNIGEAGHINSASGLGSWSEGHTILQKLMD